MFIDIEQKAKDFIQKFEAEKNEALIDKIERIKKEKQITYKEFYARSGLSSSLISDIRNGRIKEKTEVRNLVAICIGLKLYDNEATEFLNYAGVKLRKYRIEEYAYLHILMELHLEDAILGNEFLEAAGIDEKYYLGRNSK